MTLNILLQYLDPPEQRSIQNTYEEGNTVRRVLFEQSTNLVALPPDIPSLTPLVAAETLPSRSSGSFPAVPKVSPPVPSPPLGQEDKPPDTSGHSGRSLIFIIGISAAIFFLILLVIMFIVSRSKAAKTIVPWKTGLSGQLQKAFVTGELYSDLSTFTITSFMIACVMFYFPTLKLSFFVFRGP